MIFTIVLNAFYTFVAFVVSYLPTGGFPDAANQAITWIWASINVWSYVIPVDTLLEAVLVVLAFDGAMLLWHFINWAIRKIPGMQ